MIAPSRDNIEKAIKEKGYTYFTAGNYNLNIVGIRSNSKESNKFNDWICVSYKVGSSWENKRYRATTDPGLFWREQPINKLGTAILKPGQYRGAYKLGFHQGKYKALTQNAGKVWVKRDNDRDDELDFYTDEEESGYFGINIHRAFGNKKAYFVNRWSAGCQVLADNDDFDELINISKKASAIWGNLFTYTLLEEKDFS